MFKTLCAVALALLSVPANAEIIKLPAGIPWIDSYTAPNDKNEPPPLRVKYSDTDFRPAWQPPAKFRTLDLINAKIRFVQNTDTFEGCGAYGSYGTLACTTRKGRIMIMPNPCQYNEDYALLLCHELGHVRGWRHDENGKTVEEIKRTASDPSPVSRSPSRGIPPE